MGFPVLWKGNIRHSKVKGVSCLLNTPERSLWLPLGADRGLGADRLWEAPAQLFRFNGWTVTNNAASDILGHVSQCTGAGVSLGEGVGLSLTVGGSAKSPVAVSFYTPHAPAPGSGCRFPLLFILRYLAVPVLKSFASLMAVKWHLVVGLTCFSLMTNKPNILV